jgi:cbb3-type cytochrome oxidase maturation protein
MDILFLLVPLSVLLALGVMGVLAWAVWSGQFEELDSEGQRILMRDSDASLIHIKTPSAVDSHT